MQRRIFLTILLLNSLFLAAQNSDTSATAPEYGRIGSGFYFKSGRLTDFFYANSGNGKKIDYPFHNFSDEKEYLYKTRLSVDLNNEAAYRKGDGFKNRFVGKHRFLASLGESFHIYNETVFDQGLVDDPYYSGKKWRNMAAYVRAAFCEYRKDYFKVQLGTLPFEAGPSNFDNLLFSETTQGFNRVHLFLTFDNFAFDAFAGKLDPASQELKEAADAKTTFNKTWKNIAMHRLRFFPSRYFMLNLTETVVYYGDISWEYLNPFNLYHGLQLNKQVAANTLGTLEAESHLTDHLRIYGAFLLDDYQFDHQELLDLEPNEIGWQGGISLKNILADSDLLEYEYAKITNRTFNAQIPGEKFMHGNQFLGHKSGNDFDIHNLKYTRFTHNASMSAAVSYQRKGAGKVNEKFSMPWMSVNFDDGYSENFPTGPVTYTFKSELDYRLFFLNWFDFESFTGTEIITKNGTSSSNFYAGIRTGFAIDYLNFDRKL